MLPFLPLPTTTSDVGVKVHSDAGYHRGEDGRMVRHKSRSIYKYRDAPNKRSYVIPKREAGQEPEQEPGTPAVKSERLTKDDLTSARAKMLRLFMATNMKRLTPETRQLAEMEANRVVPDLVVAPKTEFLPNGEWERLQRGDVDPNTSYAPLSPLRYLYKDYARTWLRWKMFLYSNDPNVLDTTKYTDGEWDNMLAAMHDAKEFTATVERLNKAYNAIPHSTLHLADVDARGYEDVSQALDSMALDDWLAPSIAAPHHPLKMSDSRYLPFTLVEHADGSTLYRMKMTSGGDGTTLYKAPHTKGKMPIISVSVLEYARGQMLRDYSELNFTDGGAMRDDEEAKLAQAEAERVVPKFVGVAQKIIKWNDTSYALRYGQVDPTTSDPPKQVTLSEGRHLYRDFRDAVIRHDAFVNSATPEVDMLTKSLDSDDVRQTLQAAASAFQQAISERNADKQEKQKRKLDAAKNVKNRSTMLQEELERATAEAEDAKSALDKLFEEYIQHMEPVWKRDHDEASKTLEQRLQREEEVIRNKYTALRNEVAELIANAVTRLHAHETRGAAPGYSPELYTQMADVTQGLKDSLTNLVRILYSYDEQERVMLTVHMQAGMQSRWDLGVQQATRRQGDIDKAKNNRGGDSKELKAFQQGGLVAARKAFKDAERKQRLALLKLQNFETKQAAKRVKGTLGQAGPSEGLPPEDELHPWAEGGCEGEEESEEEIAELD